MRHFMGVWREMVAESDVDATAKGVAQAIGTWMNSDGWCRPSQTSIARRSGYSDTTVRAATHRLADAFLLRVVWSRARDPHEYLATLPNPEAASGLTAKELRGSAASNPEADERSTPKLTRPNPEAASDEGEEGEKARGRTATDWIAELGIEGQTP